jgi:hypothetical protein
VLLLHSPNCHLGAGSEAKFAQDIFHVLGGRGLGYHQLFGNLSIREAPRH